MKTKCSFILKTSVALLLAILMVFGSVSTVIAAVVDVSTGDQSISTAAKKGLDIAGTAANADLASTGYTSLNGRLYFDNSKTKWNNVYLYVGNTGYAKSYAMTNTNYHNIWYFDYTDTFTDRTKLYFANHGDSPNGQNYSIDTQYGWNTNNSTRTALTTANNNDANSLFTPSSASAGTLTRSYPRVVAGGIASNGWDDCTDIMTYSSSQWTKTYSNVSAGSYSFAVVGFYNNWSPAYRWAAKGTLTDNGAGSWANANDGDQNIKLTLTQESDVTITLTSSNKVNVTLTPKATNYTGITAVAKGTTDGTSYSVDLGSIQSSTTVSSATGLAVSAPTESGYAFSKWVASGSGTFTNASNASTTFFPAANSEIATAQYKKSYTISKNTPTGGSVTLSNTSRVAGETYTVTLSASSGYRLKSLTVGGTDVTSSVSNNKYTGTAKGTSDTIAVVATYEAIPATTIYVKKTLASTFSNIHIWSNTGDNWTGAWPGQALSGWSSTTDGKYYYKSFNQDYSTFKFILNNNNSPQTSDSAAYATGKSYYIDTATANSAAVLTEGVPKASTITYNTGTGYTIGGTKPTSAYTGETVSFTVTASTGYRIDKVQYTPAGGTATTITPSSGTYSFTMPDKNVTVSVTTVKTYTVTLSAAGTGMGTTKQYFVGTTPGTYSNYSSAITVDEGSTVYFKVSYANGYEYNTVTNATVHTANTVFKTAAINANTTVTITAKKISHSVSVDAKYSTNGTTFATDFPSGSKPAVTIAANTATQLDGVRVTAPATDPTGYVFAGWATNAGNTGTTYFANYLDKDTTFKPNASNTTAIARYKKIFTITSSVDSTGTGAGTVTTTKTSVEAGGSYTITATPKSGSAIESIKVNNGTGTTTSPRTVSSVSADQTVVVKFKSNVKLKGSMNPTAWSGEVMTAADKSVASYSITKELAANTTYSFKHFVETNTWSTTVDSWNLNNVATHSTADDGNGGTNLTITPSVKVNVIFTSDGSKFTSITAVPADATKYNVTFKKIANTTITGEYMGTAFTTASADAVVSVYKGTDISFKVTAASGYHISNLTGASSPTFSPVVSDYKITNVTATKTITPTAAADVNVTAKTNKSSRGTVSVDKTKSYKGDTIKITVTPLTGSLKTLTATYGNGYTYEYKNSNWNVVPTGTTANNAFTNIFLNPAKAAFGMAATGAAPDSAVTGASIDEAAMAAMPDIVPVGATQTINMVMQDDSAVTINAVFDTYSADSTWYYNGYDKDSGNAVSGYHGKQMTESMVSGEKFSYYHVEGRTGTDQTFTVSNGAASSGTRYIYFTASSEGGWSTDENHQYAYFYNNSGDAGNAWPGYKMTKYTTNDYGQNVYRVEIPTSSSPTGVIFNNAGNAAHQTTNVTDLSKGGYYLLNTSHWDDTLQKTIHDWQSYDCSYPNAGYSTGTEYFYDSEIYTADFSTKGFYDHNVGSTKFTKPKDLGSDSGDYYINVLYAGKTYTINGVTKTIGSKPLVIWSAEPLAGDDENVTIYAKDGAIRGETFGATYANIADTKIYAANGASTVGTKHSGSITNQTYETYKAAKGDTIVIKTQIGATDTSTLSNAADLKAKYYVRGFCVNGEVSELLEWNANGLYTLTYKIPEDTEITKFEITPIYYLKDTTANPIVTYRVTGFTDELKQVGAGKPGWGDTLYTYPFYGKLGGQNNAFGAYPGQPMVYYKGQYQMQIPVKSTAWDPYGETAATVNNTTVSGVTMSNGYWDSVHKTIMGYGDNSTSADHVQTYDYGDFYKIFNEKKPVDNIVFDFKYRTKKHNLVNDNTSTNIAASTLTSAYGTNGNGFEMLTNFHGKNVDLFGNPLSGTAADPEQTTPIYVVSIGGVNDNVSGVENIAGYYATEWRVYAPNTPTSLSSTYKKVTVGNKSSIPPEVLVLNNDDTTSFNTTTYPSADASHNVTDWKAMYTELKKYAGHPVMISYEAADAQQGQGMYYTGTGGATRNDGRWLYSKNGENITSKIKIQYSDDNGTTWVDNEKTPKNGLSAYFTNDGVEGQMTYSTTIDPDKTFDFEAKTTNGDYKFVGWYMEDGTKITSDNASHTERSGSYTFVAKFMQVTTGQLILSHSADKGTISGTNYQGEGTAKIGVVVKNGDGETVRTYDLSTSDVTLDDKIIKSDNSDYTIEVTLEASATGNDDLGTTVLANPSGQEAKFYKNPSTTTVDKTNTIVLDSFTVGDLFSNGTTQSVKNIIYHSYFAAVTFHYDLKFEYKDRFGETKGYYRQGYLTSAQAANENYVKVFDVGQDRHERRLMPAFIQTIAPHVSNFEETITWKIVETGYAFNVQDHEYTLVNVILADQVNDDKRDVTFKLPYAHTDGIATGGNIGTADTTTNFALTGDNAVTFDTIPTLLNDGENGIYTEEEKKNWIAAPATIKDSGTTKYFQYWSVKSTSADGENDPEVARCYFQGFNFVALDNYTITPIYDVSPVDITKSGIYSGISYLETSRNQWNTKANSPKEATSTAADLLYNDFILNYNFKGAEIYNNDADSADIVELGVVVERVQELGINQDGSKDTDISHYTSLDKDETNVTEAANRTATDGQVTVTLNGKKFYKQVVDKGSLDNKNRIKFYDAFYNGAGWNMEKQTSAAKYTYKNYVYRAYTYIKYTDQNGDTQIKLADAPAYFTMYDEATATYEAPKSTTSGN